MTVFPAFRFGAGDADLEMRIHDRQIAWEDTPTPLAGGRTPAEMIGKLVAEDR